MATLDSGRCRAREPPEDVGTRTSVILVGVGSLLRGAVSLAGVAAVVVACGSPESLRTTQSSLGPSRTASVQTTGPSSTQAIQVEESRSVGTTASTEASNHAAIAGNLPSGDQWRVVDDPAHGLCLTMSAVNYGCDDVGPVIPAGAPPETPRIAGTLNPAPGVSEENAGELAYGYLPEGTTAIEYEFADGSRQAVDTVIDSDVNLWASPLEPGNNPISIRYLTASGELVFPTPLGEP